MLFPFTDRITELPDDAQFENSDENNDPVDPDDADASARHTPVSESLAPSVDQSFNPALATHPSQSETQREDNFASLPSGSDAAVPAAADPSVVFKQMKMRIRVLKAESKLNDSKISLAKAETKRDRDRRRRRNSDDQYEDSSSHIKRRAARSKTPNT